MATNELTKLQVNVDQDIPNEAPREADVAPSRKGCMVAKRDGSIEEFNPDKIRSGIEKAYRAAKVKFQPDVAASIAREVEREIEEKRILTTEAIQNKVENGLMPRNPFIAKQFELYREKRTVEREKRTPLKQIMDSIVQVEVNDINHSNANMSSHTPAGQMMTFAGEHAKDYAAKYLLSPRYARAHANGDIHIHDLDYYSSKTTTCVQYDLKDLFDRGFQTKNGSVRTPQSIQSYATLATIIFQTNQNEQHGGQSIPAFDFFMADGVRKTFYKHLARLMELHHCFATRCESDDSLYEKAHKQIVEKAPELIDSSETLEQLHGIADGLGLCATTEDLHIILSRAIRSTSRDTHQAMEGFIHNLNTMHSRGGNQVVFSSINYGTDTSYAGRMLIRELLRTTEEGLGHGEVPIFPIQIFKVKDGVNYSEEDYQHALSHFEDALSGKLTYTTPNFDLLVEACKTTATALFPNFLFLDSPFNHDEAWRADDPKRYFHEVATMGCRTRVYENVNGPRTSIGRGNLSFTSINMPRLAIIARQQAETRYYDGTKDRIEEEAKHLFLNALEEMCRLAADQLYERYQFQRTAFAMQFPFMLGNDVWKGGHRVQPNQEVGDILRQGTLGIGFIGGHNAMMALYGAGHGHCEKAWNTLHEALERMNAVAAEYKKRYSLNYAILATPAEGLSGRFTKLDRKRFGIIAGVNDRDYYVNSFHIDVAEPISIEEKIAKEAPFHALTLGGHITYVELDGEAKKNVRVILKIVRAMHQAGVGYGSINHPVDTCKQCGYKGVIYDKCPVCASDQIARLRRITGYLTGTLDGWNSAKQAEERDRIKHT